ncbi:MAG: hypothetical protein KF799_12450 [Bdellovibrionales bacterium]|nr:hypothetical protein [Bdellovibrionales bacterium]
MKRYGNHSGRSGVTRYEMSSDSITVEFNDGDIYVYTYKSAGKAYVERMKELAQAGRGLSTFISQNVKSKYAVKY